MFDLFQLNFWFMFEGKVMRARHPRQVEGAFFRSEVSGKYRQDQEEISYQERRQDHPYRDVRQAPFVCAQDRNHQQRQEKQSDIRLEIAGANGLGVDAREFPEIHDFPAYAVFVDRLGAMHGDRRGAASDMP